MLAGKLIGGKADVEIEEILAAHVVCAQPHRSSHR